jgi:hypothetical protein
MSTLQLNWDLGIERLTLGGALVLRQEAEILSILNKFDQINLNISYDPTSQNFPEKIFDAVFNSSAINFNQFSNLSGKVTNWPLDIMLKSTNFSYYSFERISQLYENNNVQVDLSWKEDIIKETKLFVNKFIKPIITVHLKYISPYNISDSNADIIEWRTFISKNKDFDFIIIGDDKLPDEITNLSNVHYASELSLSCQLCLVSNSTAFLGTASGVCNAAFFSQTPFVVFKHPLHHINEMQNELGNNNKFNFSSNKQLLLRELATHQTIQEAFNLLV